MLTEIGHFDIFHGKPPTDHPASGPTDDTHARI
jgi:hypothetical protein